LRGISERRYGETLVNAARAFGVSPSSVSRRIIEVTTQKLKEFKERDLADLCIVALFIDTVRRANEAFLVALGFDEAGHKHAPGSGREPGKIMRSGRSCLPFWKKRCPVVSRKVLFVTDGGKGIIKALRDMSGSKFIRQRRTIY
jgi:putative transposase